MIQRFRSSSPRRFSKARAEADLLRECLGPAELGGEKFWSLTKAALITVFSARLYGSRSRKNQKLLDGVKTAVEASQSC